jgi:2-dehydropantoate 2-reductase
MKILIYGAGVLGSLYAAPLQAAGHTVMLLARGQRLADLRAQGIVLEDARTGQRTTTHVDVVEQLTPEDVYDLIIVLMRKNQVDAILPALAANQHTPTILFMTNNASGAAAYVAALGAERVLLGFPGASGVRAGAAVRVYVAPRRIQPTTIGELDGTITPRLQAIAELFEQAGFPVAISRNVDAWLKTHVALVSPIANALYLAGGDNYRLAHTRDGLVLLIRAIREGLQVLRAHGIPITPPKYRALAGLLLGKRLTARHRMPLAAKWQRALAGRRGAVEAARLMARVETRYDELYAGRTHYVNRAMRHHLEARILPILALYQALREDTGDQNAALDQVDELFHTVFAGKRRQVALLRLLPDPFLLFRWIARRKMQRSYPPEGWTTEWVADDKQFLAFTIHRCVYLETMMAYGAPELMPHICTFDDWMFETLPPTIVWERTMTLGRGGDHCDFCWRRVNQAQPTRASRWQDVGATR